MDTNALLQRWATLSLAEIEAEIQRGQDADSAAQLLGADTLAELRAISFARPAPGPRPNVVLLPGLMGSLLASVRGRTSLLWINPLLFLRGEGRLLRLGPDGRRDEAPEVEVLPIGLEKLTYLKLSLLLNRQTNLYEFPYDWRRPIESNADLLHAAIERWSEGDPTRPFYLVGHSMGGLVARAYLARQPLAAAQHVRQVILHGTPHFGATNAVDGLLNGNSMMATVDKLNPGNAMRQLVFTLPSIYQILPAPPDLFPAGQPYPFDFDLYQAAAWGLPEIRQDYLDAGRRFHQSLAAADPQVPITIIAGCHIETAVGAHLGSAAPRLQLHVVSEGETSGDGTVPLWSARLPGAQVHYLQAVHAKLPADASVIRATLDLIQTGGCDLPTTLPPPRPAGFLPGLPFAPEAAAADLRLKVSQGVAGEDDLRRLFFAF